MTVLLFLSCNICIQLYGAAEPRLIEFDDCDDGDDDDDEEDKEKRRKGWNK